MRSEGIDRRGFLKVSGAGAAIAVTGIEGIVAARSAPAYAQGTKLHWVRWVDFIPESDVELKRVTLGFGNNVKDRTTLDTLTPGKVISDLLLFEVPKPKATHLDLDLPGANCGVRGTFQFRIPLAAIGSN